MERERDDNARKIGELDSTQRHQEKRIDEMSLALTRLDGRVGVNEKKITQVEERVEECETRGERMYGQVDEIHNALINERSNTLRIISHSGSVDGSPGSDGPFISFLKKYTVIIVALTATMALMGSLWLGFAFLSKYAVTH